MHTRPRGNDTEPSDADLVHQARGGASPAFEALVRRYQGIVIARAYAILRDRGEAEDAAQEAFLRTFRSLRQLRSPDAFGSWLLQTVANVARRAATKRARRPIVLPDVDASHNPGPRVEVLDAIATLPEKYQQVIHLFYFQGHSCAGIATMLGLQIGSVTARLTRARRKLRELLREDTETP